jgi:hypothetical protein
VIALGARTAANPPQTHLSNQPHFLSPTQATEEHRTNRAGDKKGGPAMFHLAIASMNQGMQLVGPQKN